MEPVKLANEMKLWVVGELSGDPNDWNDLGFRYLVVARNESEAEKIAGITCGAIEVTVNRPMLLSSYQSDAD